MQDNVEDIFDGFIHHKLNEFAPRVTLLHSAYLTFLSERQKKKKRRYFWIFFSLLLLVPLFSCFFFLSKELQPGKSTNLKSITSTQSSNLPTRKSRYGSGVLTVTEDNRIKDIATEDLILLHNAVSKKSKRALQKNSFQPDKKSNIEDIYTDTNNNNKSTLDSILFNIKNQHYSYNLRKDSIIKNRARPLVDTFYIVW